eukprot:Rhum_TRINITY_DN21039_c0_g1::Rhum_TRINITY_DN21039_c0_g1_i1::g.172925::m.172925
MRRENAERGRAARERHFSVRHPLPIQVEFALVRSGSQGCDCETRCLVVLRVRRRRQGIRFHTVEKVKHLEAPGLRPAHERHVNAAVCDLREGVRHHVCRDLRNVAHVDSHKVVLELQHFCVVCFLDGLKRVGQRVRLLAARLPCVVRLPRLFLRLSGVVGGAQRHLDLGLVAGQRQHLEHACDREARSPQEAQPLALKVDVCDDAVAHVQEGEALLRLVRMRGFARHTVHRVRLRVLERVQRRKAAAHQVPHGVLERADTQRRRHAVAGPCRNHADGHPLPLRSEAVHQLVQDSVAAHTAHHVVVAHLCAQLFRDRHGVAGPRGLRDLVCDAEELQQRLRLLPPCTGTAGSAVRVDDDVDGAGGGKGAAGVCRLREAVEDTVLGCGVSKGKGGGCLFARKGFLVGLAEQCDCRGHVGRGVDGHHLRRVDQTHGVGLNCALVGEAAFGVRLLLDNERKRLLFLRFFRHILFL